MGKHVSKYIKKEDAIYYAEWERAYHAAMIINDLPGEDVVPVRHGKWLNRESTPDSKECSVCGNSSKELGFFCNHCGAKMDKE